MSHSLIGADARTHCKVVAVALAGAAALVMFGNAAWRAQADITTAHAQVNRTIFVAGKPAMSAAIQGPVVR